MNIQTGYAFNMNIQRIFLIVQKKIPVDKTSKENTQKRK